MKAKILLVEDDDNLGNVLQDYLEIQNYEVLKARDGVEGLDAFKVQKFDLLILDVMMPRMDGFTLAKHIRAHDAQVPIIFLTARGLSEDRIEGFKTGADDYLTKPFSSEELELRISAILRRSQTSVKKSNEKPASNKKSFQLGNFEFDPVNHELRIEEERIKLTPKETGLLLILCQNKNQLLTRQTVLRAVWGKDNYFFGRSMDVFITKLRKLLKKDPRISIVNIHGIGFRLQLKDE